MLRPMFIRIAPTLLVGAMCSTACTAELPANVSAEAASGQHNQALAWTMRDDPALFGLAKLERNLDALPAQGEVAQAPWAASYWPTYEDSINFKWDGPTSDSASRKYEKAFAKAGIEDAVSNARGIDSRRGRAKKCTTSSECESTRGEACAKRDGHTEGLCTATWFGLCHAWAPAAILVPEPKHAVERNGVTFKVNDIKALVTLVHDQTQTRFVSLRCNADDNGTGIGYDEMGRPLDGTCIDTNPGTLHLILANLIGIERKSFVFDRTYDDEVWNQPLRDFHVQEKRNISRDEANALIGVPLVGGVKSTFATSVAHNASETFAPIAVVAGEPFTVKMTGTGDGDLYVRFGEAPTPQAYDCRPYAGSSNESCNLTVPAGVTQAFIQVVGVNAAKVSLVVTNGGRPAESYPFNARAERFAFVRADVGYILESSPQTDGPLHDRIDHYTGRDTYEYILELDGQGAIIGGEWLNESKRAHPDFLWLPTGPGASSIAGVSYEDVMSLARESVIDVPPTPASLVVTEPLEATVAEATDEIAPVVETAPVVVDTAPVAPPAPVGL